jgi:hypothetical protein
MIAQGVPLRRARIYRLPGDIPQKRKWVALGLPKNNPTTEDPSYPLVPDEADLIGFVTTGNFNLAEGRGHAIGSVLIAKLRPIHGRSEPSSRNLCIIRNSGALYGRLARWDLTE